MTKVSTVYHISVVFVRDNRYLGDLSSSSVAIGIGHVTIIYVSPRIAKYS